MEEYCVVSFQITSHAFIFEKLIKKEGIPIKLIPTPRQISSSCGMSADVPCEEMERIKEICKQNLIEGTEFHKLEKKKKVRKFFK